MLCNKKVKKIFAVVVLLVIFGGCGRERECFELEPLEDADKSETVEVQDTPEETANGNVQKIIAVHVCGAVTTPGVYYFPEQTRVITAVEAAGGFTEDAGRDYLNLAAAMSDGEKIYVPTKAEQELYAEEERTQLQQLVNINTADKEQLMTLPGIGESKALDIISYREKNGEFTNASDIMQVTGIKESVYNKICDKIFVN